MTNESDLGGDPVCWLDRVCPECGLFLDDSEAPCPRCRHESDSSPQSGPVP